MSDETLSTAADPASALVSAAEAAAAMAGERAAQAAAELVRAPGFRIGDAARARAAAIVGHMIAAAEAALRAAEPAFATLPEGAGADRFAAAGLLALSGIGAAALARAEEHELATALAFGAGEEEAEGPGARRLDPIGGEVVAESFAVHAAEAARLDRTGEPLLPLVDLAAEERHRLFWHMAACLADALRQEHQRPEEAVDRLAGAAVARALAAIDEGDGIAAVAMVLAAALAQKGAIDDELVAGAFAAGRLASLAAVLAVRLGIDFHAANAMLAEPARAALLLRAAAIGRDVAAAIVLALCFALDRGLGEDAGEQAAALIAGFEALDVERARAEVRRARLEPAYRDALHALAGGRC